MGDPIYRVDRFEVEKHADLVKPPRVRGAAEEIVDYVVLFHVRTLEAGVFRFGLSEEQAGKLIERLEAVVVPHDGF